MRLVDLTKDDDRSQNDNEESNSEETDGDADDEQPSQPMTMDKARALLNKLEVHYIICILMVEW